MRRLLPVLLVLLVACTGEEAPPPESPGPTPEASAPTHVLKAETTYYTASPAQARPEDGTLPAGTKVRFVQDAGSYCRVKTTDGLDVWVATDALRKIE